MPGNGRGFRPGNIGESIKQEFGHVWRQLTKPSREARDASDIQRESRNGFNLRGILDRGRDGTPTISRNITNKVDAIGDIRARVDHTARGVEDLADGRPLRTYDGRYYDQNGQPRNAQTGRAAAREDEQQYRDMQPTDGGPETSSPVASPLQSPSTSPAIKTVDPNTVAQKEPLLSADTLADLNRGAAAEAGGSVRVPTGTGTVSIPKADPANPTFTPASQATAGFDINKLKTDTNLTADELNGLSRHGLSLDTAKLGQAAGAPQLITDKSGKIYGGYTVDKAGDAKHDTTYKFVTREDLDKQYSPQMVAGIEQGLQLARGPKDAGTQVAATNAPAPEPAKPVVMADNPAAKPVIPTAQV